MSCKCATFDEDDGRYSCSISGDECVYMFPDSKACAEEYGEGPDTPQHLCTECKFFIIEKRCCNCHGVITEIEEDVIGCGAWEDKNESK